jgi:hypothetical protein
MPRKPTDTIQVNLRIKEAMRRRLEAAAKKRDVSLNFEMVDRLKGSFDQSAHHTIEVAAAKIELAAEVASVHLGHYAREQEIRTLLDDLREAGEALVAQIEQLPAEMRAREALKDAVEWMRTAIAAVERKYGQIQHD